MTTKTPEKKTEKTDPQTTALAQLEAFDREMFLHQPDHALPDSIRAQCQAVRSKLALVAVGGDAEEVQQWTAEDFKKMFLLNAAVSIKSQLALAPSAEFFYFISWKNAQLTTELKQNLESNGFVCEFVQEVEQEKAVIDRKFKFCEKSAATHLRVSLSDESS